MKKFKLLLQVTAFLIILSGVLVNANTPESKFDENKSWNNMVWVTYGTHDGSGNPERNFTVKNEYGKELSFSLVETFDSTDAKYWIIANDRYGTKGTGISPIYDPTAEGSIAKYVNEAFVQENAWEWIERTAEKKYNLSVDLHISLPIQTLRSFSHSIRA